MKKTLTLLVALFFSTPISWAGQSFETIQWRTKNGVPVVFYQAMEVPMLDISLAFAAGSAYDQDNFGLSTLTTRMLNQGNKGLDATAIAEKLADTGAQYAGENNQDMVVLSLKTLTNPTALQKATETFSMIVNHPDFSSDVFNREKNQQLMAISQAEESPDEMANQTFFQALYKNHPYGHPTIGTRSSVSALKVEQARQFYHQFFVSKNAVMVLVGAIDKTKAEELAELITQELAIGHAAEAIPTAKPLADEMSIELKFPSSQAVLRLGQLGIMHNNEHYFPLIVGNYILGGGSLVSELSHELREKRGLTYGVYSQFSPMPGIGPFIISLSTQNSQTQTAVDVTRATLSAFIQHGPTDKELVAAKQYLTGSFPLSLASNGSIANVLLRMAFYHLPGDYLRHYIAHINAVTTEEIKTAFQLVKPNKLLQVTVGK